MGSRLRESEFRAILKEVIESCRAFEVTNRLQRLQKLQLGSFPARFLSRQAIRTLFLHVQLVHPHALDVLEALAHHMDPRTSRNTSENR